MLPLLNFVTIFFFLNVDLKVLFDHSFISKVSVALSVYLAFFNYFQCFNLTSVINYPGSLDLNRKYERQNMLHLGRKFNISV